jgi:hypothetical protein
MNRIVKRMCGPFVALILIAACGESVETGAVIPAPAIGVFESHRPSLRTILAHEFAEGADTAIATPVPSGDTLSQVLAHELAGKMDPSKPSREAVPTVQVR